MQRVGFVCVSALFCIVFLLASCDINPMTETVIRDPVTVRFYNGETLFQSVTVERGSDVAMPSTSPSKAGHDFLHWARITSGGDERAYTEHAVLYTGGMPSTLDSVSMHARFRNVAFPHEVSGVSHAATPFPPIDKIITLTWTNPDVVHFSHVMIEGEWVTVEGFWVTSPELEPGANTVSFLVRDPRPVTIVAVDTQGNMSRGVRHFIEWDTLQPDW